jgi:hypothetical protein
MKSATKPSPQQRANLRTCASCEWIYEGHSDCPKCQFGSYGARFVYGNKCYRFSRTQEPWMKKKLSSYECQLLDEIEKSLPKKERLNYFPLGDP